MTFIFDFDGTLIDSYDIMVKQLCILLDPYEKQEAFSIRREVLETSIIEFMHKQVIKHGLDSDALKSQFLELQSQTMSADYPLLPDVKETLTELSKHNRLFLYTHRDSTTYGILEEHGLRHLFESVITSDDAFERKPSPDALNHLIETYALDRSKTYYVGDRSLDIACGINAGVKTIYFGELNKENKDATLCIHGLCELLNLPSSINVDCSSFY